MWCSNLHHINRLNRQYSHRHRSVLLNTTTADNSGSCNCSSSSDTRTCRNSNTFVYLKLTTNITRRRPYVNSRCWAMICALVATVERRRSVTTSQSRAGHLGDRCGRPWGRSAAITTTTTATSVVRRAVAAAAAAVGGAVRGRGRYYLCRCGNYFRRIV